MGSSVISVHSGCCAGLWEGGGRQLDEALGEPDTSRKMYSELESPAEGKILTLRLYV